MRLRGRGGQGVVMRKHRRSTVVLLIAALAAVGGCASNSPPEAAAPTTTAMSDVEVLALGKQVAQCIRDNGLPGFPDPYFDNGQLQLPPVDANVQQQGEAVLQGPCRELWQRLEAVLPEQQQERRSKDEPRGPMAAEDLDKLKQFTECMRQHGLPTWPDPDDTGEYHLGGAGLPEGLGKGQRPVDATFRDALQACDQYSVPGMEISN